MDLTQRLQDAIAKREVQWRLHTKNTFNWMHPIECSCSPIRNTNQYRILRCSEDLCPSCSNLSTLPVFEHMICEVPVTTCNYHGRLNLCASPQQSLWSFWTKRQCFRSFRCFWSWCWSCWSCWSCSRPGASGTVIISPLSRCYWLRLGVGFKMQFERSHLIHLDTFGCSKGHHSQLSIKSADLLCW
jgi:hypothetical protein